MDHRIVRRHLHAYMDGTLDAVRRSEIEVHLQECSTCSAELHDIREVAGMFDHSPADILPDEYWDTLVGQTMERIRSEPVRSLGMRDRLRNAAEVIRAIHRPAIGVAIGAAACAIVVVLVLRPGTTPGHHRLIVQHAGENAGPDSVEARTDRYLRRSQALLVGLVNMKTSDDTPVDLTVERELSRSLIRESRVLKREPLDLASARVVYDIEPILVQLANAHPDEGQPAVHLIRKGIFERNLLFKVRMASVLRDAAPLATNVQ
jgi:Putative zinc-finger